MFFSKIYVVLFFIFITAQCGVSTSWFKFNIFGGRSSEIEDSVTRSETENSGSSSEITGNCNDVALAGDAETAECRKKLMDPKYVQELRLRVSSVGKTALLELTNDTKINEVATSFVTARRVLKNINNMPMVCKEKTGPIVKAAFESYVNLTAKYDSSIVKVCRETSNRISSFIASGLIDGVNEIRAVLNDSRDPLSAESRKEIEDAFFSLRELVNDNLSKVAEILKEVNDFNDEATRTLHYIRETMETVRSLTKEERDKVILQFNETEKYKNIGFNISGVHVPIADVYFGSATLKSFKNDREREKEYCLFCVISLQKLHSTLNLGNKRSWKVIYDFESMIATEHYTEEKAKIDESDPILAKQFMEGIAELNNLSVDCLKFNQLVSAQTRGLEAMKLVVEDIIAAPKKKEKMNNKERYEAGVQRLLNFAKEYDILLSRVVTTMETCVFCRIN